MDVTTARDPVAAAVMAAKERGIVLRIAEAAERLARTAGCPDQVREIADALVREGIRLKVAMEIDSPRPVA